jgi:fumarate reductase flavoprotein subunit
MEERKKRQQDNKQTNQTPVAVDEKRRTLLKGAIGLGMAASISPLALHLTAEKAEANQCVTLPSKWDETVDVLVVGSGFAGFAAAAEAAGTKSETLIVEKMPVYGGNSIISGGSYASWDSKYHFREKLKMADDSPAKWKADWLKGGDYYGVPELIDIIVNNAPETLNWLIDEGGLEIRQTVAQHGGHSAPRAHMALEAVGRPYIQALKKIADSRGVKIRLGTEITRIWRKDWESPVAGVEVMRGKKKSNIRIEKALILASGGFSADIKMRMAFNPAIVPEFNCTNHKGATGEVIRYAQAVGGEAIQMAFIQLFPFAEPESGVLDVYATYGAKGAGAGFVYINKKGKRFVNEMERRDTIAYAQIKGGQKPTYSLFNELMMKKMQGEKELADGVAKGRFIKGDTIIQLAEKLGMSGATLQETVTKYNEYLQDGKDADFNKKFTKQMAPLIEGPFFALPQWPAIHHTQGGLRINTSAQVLDIWGKPIPRLYAAGEVTGGIEGSNRLAANAYPDCMVIGRLAGRNAGQEKPIA